ncbi:MAG: hypothetical protein HC913_16500, partial [Microscillaceae bacterium]|nr:hypothetical protein [Microscillaceae bacterium]
EALQEFDHMVALLRQNGVEVMVLEDSPQSAQAGCSFPQQLGIFSRRWAGVFVSDVCP